MPQYNGHKNWNHWNVSLWINNDVGLYAIARQCVRYSITKDRAAGLLLSMIHDNVGTHTPRWRPPTQRQPCALPWWTCNPHQHTNPHQDTYNMMNQFEVWKGMRDGQRIALLVIADREDYDIVWGFYRLLATLPR